MKPVFKLVGNSIDRHPALSLEGAFPDNGSTPSGVRKFLRIDQVIVPVLADFRLPEFDPAARPAEQMSFMAMPEAAMNKDDGAELRKHKIRFSR